LITQGSSADAAFTWLCPRLQHWAGQIAAPAGCCCLPCPIMHTHLTAGSCRQFHARQGSGPAWLPAGG
jgi:hypothetical protein